MQKLLILVNLLFNLNDFVEFKYVILCEYRITENKHYVINKKQNIL